MALGKVEPPSWANEQIPSVISREYKEFLSYIPADLKVLDKSWRDDIIRQRGISIVQEMLQDARVSQASSLTKSAVVNVGYKVVIDGDIINDEKMAKEIKADVAFLFRNVKNSSEFFKKILSAFDFGYSFNVINAKIMTRGRFKGKMVCESIVPIPPSAYRIGFDETGVESHIESNIIGMMPKDTEDKIKKITLDRIIYMRLGGNFESPYGRSQILKAYEAWWNKKIIRRMRNTAMDRFGTPYMVGKVSPNTTDKKRKDLLSTIVKMSVESVGVINNDESIEAVQTGGLAGVDAFQNILNYEDTEIVASIAGSTLNVMNNQGGGSYAQARVHQDNFLYQVQEIIDNLQEVINQQFVRRFVAASYGEDIADGVTVKWEAASDPYMDTFISRFQQLAPLLFDNQDPREKEWMRKLIGWPDVQPVMDEDEKGNLVDPNDKGHVLIRAAQAQTLGLTIPPNPEASPGADGDGGAGGQDDLSSSNNIPFWQNNNNDDAQNVSYASGERPIPRVKSKVWTPKGMSNAGRSINHGQATGKRGRL